MSTQLLHTPSDLPVVSADDPRIEKILGQLCDILAYYYFAVKVDNNSDLQAILKANAKDACKWVSWYLQQVATYQMHGIVKQHLSSVACANASDLDSPTKRKVNMPALTLSSTAALPAHQ